MKNKLLILLCMILVLEGVAFPLMNFKGGIESSGFSFSYEGNEEWGKSKGLRIGVGFSSSYSRRFVFQPELYLVKKGSKVTQSYLEENLTEKISLDYLELPLLFRYSVLRKEKWNVGILFGLFAAIRLNASQITKFQNDSRSEDIKEDFKKADFGSVFGVEMVLIKEKFNIFLDLRYTSGMTDIRENRDFQDKIKTRSFSLMAGVGF